MTTYQEILSAAQSLAPAERAGLIAELWNKLSPEDWPFPSTAWMEEANRRSDAYDRGEIKVSPWDEARARARRRAGLDRSDG